MNFNRISKMFGVVATIAMLSACGGGSHNASLPAGGSASQYSGPLSSATFTIRIPGAASASSARSPKYVSSGTKSVKFTLNTASALTAGQVTSYNARAPWSIINVAAPSSSCVVSGADFVCTMAIQLPPGSDNATFTTYDNTNATGNILSQQIVTATITVASSNSFSFTFDANANTMTITGSGYCQFGTVANASSFGAVGTSPITFTVSYTDAAGKTIVTPGLPKLEIQDNTATYQSASGTINATGGTVGFTINQSAQTFTLTPSSSTLTGASINVKAVEQNSTGSSDGLSFAKTSGFTFSTGTAPPSHNFLAAVEQTGVGSGQVDLYNVTLGGSGSADSFSAFNPATLAVTNSTNENKPDIDNPQVLAWDSNGDLLVGNGHDGGANLGNMACIPVGAIATGANTSTTVSSNVTSPTGIAYDSRNGAVALANNPATATYQLSEYLLTGNYVAGTHNLAVSGTNVGSHTVTAMPSLSAGTFAITVTNGCDQDVAGGHNSCGYAPVNKVAIFDGNGVETDITDTSTYNIDEPFGIGWDAANNQLAVSGNSVWHHTLAFYSVTSGPSVSFVKTLTVGQQPDRVAVSADGHVAVVTHPGLSVNPAVEIYDNTSNRSQVLGAIPFYGTSDNNCFNYIYGDASIFSITWLSNTKLLIALQSTTSGVVNGNNGLYIFDISASAVPAGHSDQDPNCGGSPGSFPAAPKQTGFVHLANHPLGTAFKP